MGKGATVEREVTLADVGIMTQIGVSPESVTVLYSRDLGDFDSVGLSGSGKRLILRIGSDSTEKASDLLELFAKELQLGSPIAELPAERSPQPTREFSRIVPVGPIVLQKSDLGELIRILRSDASERAGTRVTTEITIGRDDAQIRGNSLEELLTQDIPDMTSECSIKQNVWRESEIIGSVSVECHSVFANFDVRSTNETWFRGRAEELRLFFRRKKPWYSLLLRVALYLSALFLLLGLAGLVAIFENAIRRSWSWLLAASAMIVTGILLTVAAIPPYRIFPYVVVVLVARDRTNRSQGVLITLTLLTFLATLAGALISAFSRSK